MLWLAIGVFKIGEQHRNKESLIILRFYKRLLNQNFNDTFTASNSTYIKQSVFLKVMDLYLLGLNN